MTSGTYEAGAAEVTPTATRLGPIAVRTDSATVSKFQLASGAELLPGMVPLIFPIRWLALPEVRARLLDAVGARDTVPVHESQSFTTTRRLELDRDYLLSVEIARRSQPDRLTLQGTVSTPEGNACVRFETILRLVGLGGGEREPR